MSETKGFVWIFAIHFLLKSKKKVMSTNYRTYRIASIPGDGIGLEVTEQAIRVLERIEERLNTFTLQFDHFDWSSERYKALGNYMAPDGLDQLKKYDAILFGAVGSLGKFQCTMVALRLKRLIGIYATNMEPNSV